MFRYRKELLMILFGAKEGKGLAR